MVVRAYTLCVLVLRLVWGSAVVAPAAGCDESLLHSICESPSTNDISKITNIGNTASSTSCAICVGRHQHELRVAGCSPLDVQRYCSGGGVGVYVSSNEGSDANDGRSPSTALRTLDAAIVALEYKSALPEHVNRTVDENGASSPAAYINLCNNFWTTK